MCNTPATFAGSVYSSITRKTRRAATPLLIPGTLIGKGGFKNMLGAAGPYFHGQQRGGTSTFPRATPVWEKGAKTCNTVFFKNV
ncbi:hypothetical protein WUni_008820, partial [Wolbachia endosymbiont of Muscidifurax uniraptor]